MKPLRVAMTALLLGAGAFGVWRLHQTTLRLEARVAALRSAVKTSDHEHQHAENRRLRALLDELNRGEAAAANALRAETEAARRELAEREQRAARTRTERAAKQAPPDNRDPHLGLARLEYFQNAGRATPMAAVQTVIWAAMKGEAAELAAGVTLTAAGREKALEWLARLPAEARARFATPESLAALFVSDQVLKSGAMQLVGATPVDASHAFVEVRALETGGRIRQLPLVLGGNGWQVALAEQEIATLQLRIAETPP